MESEASQINGQAKGEEMEPVCVVLVLFGDMPPDDDLLVVWGVTLD